MESARDLAVFLNTDDHAVSATFDNLTTVSVIFDNAYFLAGDDIATTQPQAIANISDLTSVENAIDKTLVISGTTFVIRNAEPDETGVFCTLLLEQQGYV